MRKFLCCIVLACASCTSSLAASPVAHRIRATPEATGSSTVDVSFATPRASVKPHVVAAAPVVRPKPAATADLTSFRRLGTWVDVFDYTNDPSTIRPLVDAMPALGVKTLYLETARPNSATDIAYPSSLSAALDDAKARGLHVVAWYPPDFANVALDVRRSLAAIHFRTARGNMFDAFASDIEYTQGVPDATVRSARTIQYSQALRDAVGSSYALGGIVIPPTSLQINPQRWPNFPWRALAPLYDVFMPMNYWTAHARTAATATDLTRRNDELIRSFTGKPVHNIGGLGADADPSQVAAYVQAAMSSGSLGGGLYDFKTTASNLWSVLRRFN